MLTALATGLAGVAGTVPAHAADRVQASSCYTTYVIYGDDGYPLARLDWSANPNDCYAKGDSFRVCDLGKDGWGVEGDLRGTSRWSSTQGHDSPYCGGWSSGDLVEHTPYTVDMYLVKGLDSKPLEAIPVYS
ncbi:MAG TPA: hypothetical protein VGN37_07880 [Actinocatenispora sp.]